MPLEKPVSTPFIFQCYIMSSISRTSCKFVFLDLMYEYICKQIINVITLTMNTTKCEYFIKPDLAADKIKTCRRF